MSCVLKGGSSDDADLPIKEKSTKIMHLDKTIIFFSI
jgi:hypothetical protein